MATPGEILTNLESLNLQEIIQEAVQEVSQDYVKRNLDQLYEGLGSDGQKIEPQYKVPYYARRKNRMNAKPGYGTPDLYLTGAFAEGTEVALEGDELVEQSSVEYAQYLEKNYSEEQIWGLTEDNHEQFVNEDLRPLIIEKISELTGLS